VDAARTRVTTDEEEAATPAPDPAHPDASPAAAWWRTWIGEPPEGEMLTGDRPTGAAAAAAGTASGLEDEQVDGGEATGAVPALPAAGLEANVDVAVPAPSVATPQAPSADVQPHATSAGQAGADAGPGANATLGEGRAAGSAFATPAGAQAPAAPDSDAAPAAGREGAPTAASSEAKETAPPGAPARGVEAADAGARQRADDGDDTPSGGRTRATREGGSLAAPAHATHAASRPPQPDPGSSPAAPASASQPSAAASSGDAAALAAAAPGSAPRTADRAARERAPEARIAAAQESEQGIETVAGAAGAGAETSGRGSGQGRAPSDSGASVPESRPTGVPTRPSMILMAAADGTLRLAPAVAAGPVAAPAGAMPSETAANIEQIVASMRVMTRETVSQATIHLRPEHFGQVSINIRVDGKLVSAVIQTESAQVREWLQAHEAALRSGLAEQGLQLDRLYVSRDPRQDRRDGHPQQQERRRQRPRDEQQGTFEIAV
jgi:flagellar hook-length control protein FliK